MKEVIRAWLRGAMRVLDLCPAHDAPDPNPEADARALEADWRAVGEDLRRAMADAR